MEGDNWWDRTWLGVLNLTVRRHRQLQQRWQQIVQDLSTELVAVKVERDLLHDYAETLRDERDLAVSMLTDQALRDWAEWETGDE